MRFAAAINIFLCVFGSGFGFDVYYNLYKSAQCLSKEYNFRFFTQISVKKCVKECAVRPMCQAVNYHRNYNLCELLSQAMGNVVEHALLSCQFIKKSDIVVNLPTSCQLCETGETCDVDEMTGTAKCVFKECKPLNLPNGRLLGNMNEIGTRALHYTLFVRKQNADVPYLPVCIESLGYCPGLLLDDGSYYTGEDMTTIRNNCDSHVLRCQNSGEWEPYPICNHPVIARYLGCFRDCPNRLLDRAIYPPLFAPLTVDRCIVMCTSRGYNFAYLEFLKECFCGNEVLHFIQVPESECHYPCPNNTAQICGGDWRASLYDLTITTGNSGIVNNVTSCDPDGDCVPECLTEGPLQIHT